LEKTSNIKIEPSNLRFFKADTILSKELIDEGLIFLIDKPLNWTSFDVVNKLRYALRIKFGIKKLKVGHAGTLDPLATGLIIVCCGKYTKIIDHLLNEHKSYTATIKLGATTATYDAESVEENLKSTEHIEVKDIQPILENFKGEIEQIPPIYSAIKVNGQTSYNLARRGKEIELTPRKIHIFSLEMLNFNNPYLTIKVDVSKGTYIRSLGYDIGSSLKVGGYLVELRRETIGNLRVDEGFQLDVLLGLIGN
jgi:tRNA pseudouridine55 synthase